MEALIQELAKRTGESEETLRPIAEDARQICLTLCARQRMTDALLPVIKEIALVMYAGLGREGETQRQEGTLQIRREDLPPRVRRQIQSLRLGRIGL